jgi:hypothetical protein
MSINPLPVHITAITANSFFLHLNNFLESNGHNIDMKSTAASFK